MTTSKVAVLVPPAPAEGARLPATLPLGRLAQTLDDIDLLFVSTPASNGVARGTRVVGDQWAPAECLLDDLAGVYDRFPARRWPDRHAAIIESLEGVPRGNGTATMTLCRDKWRASDSLRHSGRAPEMRRVATDNRVPESWADGAYLKPRFGSFGVGVRWVAPGERLPETVPSLNGEVEPAVVQRAVPVPALELDGEPVQAIAMRVLVQRAPDGHWIANPAVARVSTQERVTSVRGGATAWALDALLALADAPSTAVQAVAEAATEATIAVAQEAAEPGPCLTLEVGVDVVFDRAWTPWVIEVNGKPAGHLGALAKRDPTRFDAAHQATYERPLRALIAARR